MLAHEHVTASAPQGSSSPDSAVLSYWFVVALHIGFRSGARVMEWLAVTGKPVLFTLALALTWLAAIAGLSAKSVEGAGGCAYPHNPQWVVWSFGESCWHDVLDKGGPHGGTRVERLDPLLPIRMTLGCRSGPFSTGPLPHCSLALLPNYLFSRYQMNHCFGQLPEHGREHGRVKRYG